MDPPATAVAEVASAVITLPIKVSPPAPILLYLLKCFEDEKNRDFD